MKILHVEVRIAMIEKGHPCQGWGSESKTRQHVKCLEMAFRHFSVQGNDCRKM